MVTLKPDMTAKPDSGPNQVGRPRSVSASEVLVLAAVLGVALLAWSGLILADVGHYSLAQAFGLALLGWLAVAAIAWRVARPAVVMTSPGALWPAFWIQSPGSAVISPQFYHLWPALLASGFAAGGYTGLVNLVPLLGVMVVLVVALAVRRVFGLLAGVLAGLLLAANMLQVWGSKYQTTEVLTELLLASALLAVVIALHTGWRPAAGVGGLLLGISFLARPDGLLEVLLALAALLVLVALRRFDARAGWFAVGLTLPMPHGLVQAYVIAERYTVGNGVPRLRTLVALVMHGADAAG